MIERQNIAFDIISKEHEIESVCFVAQKIDCICFVICKSDPIITFYLETVGNSGQGVTHTRSFQFKRLRDVLHRSQIGTPS